MKFCQAYLEVKEPILTKHIVENVLKMVLTKTLEDLNMIH